MAKKLLGSGNAKAGKQKLPATVGMHHVNQGEKPWVDPEKARAASNAGTAGVMLSKELKRDKSTGIKPR